MQNFSAIRPAVRKPFQKTHGGSHRPPPPARAMVKYYLLLFNTQTENIQNLSSNAILYVISTKISTAIIFNKNSYIELDIVGEVEVSILTLVVQHPPTSPHPQFWRAASVSYTPPRVPNTRQTQLWCSGGLIYPARSFALVHMKSPLILPTRIGLTLRRYQSRPCPCHLH